MKLTFYTLIVFFVVNALEALAGGVVDSGGDTVLCSSSNHSGEVHRSLDFLLTDRPDGYDLQPVASVEESLARISAIIHEKLPELKSSWDDFSSQIFNTEGITRVWTASSYGLREIGDEDLNSTETVPENCKSNDRIRIVQTVARTDSDRIPRQKIYYSYVPTVIDELKSTNPMDLSFLLVHEWLWDHSKNVRENRQITRFFHTKQFKSMSRQAIIAKLEALYFYIPNLSQDYSCYSRSRAIRSDHWIAFEVVVESRQTGYPLHYLNSDANNCLDNKISDQRNLCLQAGGTLYNSESLEPEPCSEGLSRCYRKTLVFCGVNQDPHLNLTRCETSCKYDLFNDVVMEPVRFSGVNEYFGREKLSVDCSKMCWNSETRKNCRLDEIRCR